MLFDHDELAKIVIFCDDKGAIASGMHYSEFEAILDGYAPFIEYAGQKAKAIYVEVDNTLHLQSSAFVYVDFDEKGGVSSDWNLPLDKLVRNASNGPDLGAGAIRLACKSQCPIHFYRDSLWDPDLRSGNRHFSALKKLILVNSLGIQFKEDPNADTESATLLLNQVEPDGKFDAKTAQQMQKDFAEQLHSSVTQQVREHRLELTTLENEFDSDTEKLKLDHAKHVNSYKQKIQDIDKKLQEEKQKNSQLKETITNQSEKMEGLRDYFEHKLDRFQGKELEQLQLLKENYGMEMEAKIAAATIELKEMLQMKDIELMYRSEQESQMRSEIESLRQENKDFLSNSGDHLLEKLSLKGVSFVTYQTGAGHINIASSDISKFMENPIQYTAQYCGVSQQHYSAWLLHYQAPVCNHTLPNGDFCGEDIERVGIPTDFYEGESDRCKQHCLLNFSSDNTNPDVN